MAERSVNQSKCCTDLLQLYRHAGVQHGLSTLFRSVSGEEITYRRFSTDVDALGTTLLSRGYRNAHVLIVGESCPLWACACLAATGIGRAIPLDPTLDGAEIAAVAQASDATLIIASKKLRRQLSALPTSVNRLFFDDLAEWIEDGKAQMRRGNRSFSAFTPDPDTPCVMLYPNGARRHGVMHSHRSLCFAVDALSRAVLIRCEDVFLSARPLHHAYELVCGLLLPLSCGASIALSRGAAHLSRELRAVKPSVMVSVPRPIEALHRRLQAVLAEQKMNVSVRLGAGSTAPLWDEHLRLHTRRKLFTGLHRSLGGRLRLMLSAAPVSADVSRDFRELGIAVLCGCTVHGAAAPIATNRDTRYNDGSAGLALPDTLLDIWNEDADGIGEVRVLGGHLSCGYYRASEDISCVKADGWHYTGEIGRIDADGFLHLIGRRQNAIAVANGIVYPEELEARLALLPLVSEALVSGEASPDGGVKIVALIYPDRDEASRLLGPTYRESALRHALLSSLSELNASLLPHKRIVSFTLSPDPLPRTLRGMLHRG